MSSKEKVISLLGLAMRSGNVVSGDFIVEKTIKKRQVKLLLLSEEVAKNNAEKYEHLSERYGLTMRQILTKEELGNAIGKEARVVVGVIDAGFAKKLVELIDTDKIE